MRRILSLAMVGCLAALSAGPVLAQSSVFSFDNVSPGINAPPAQTIPSSSGVPLDLTFDTTDPAALFGISDNSGVGQIMDPAGGNVLSGVGGAIGPTSLDLAFSSPITNPSFDYATGSDDGAGGLLSEDLLVDLGADGSIDATLHPGGANSVGYFQDVSGLLSLGGAPFNMVRLSAGTPNSQFVEFALDNVTVTAVPEPGILALGLSTVLPAAWWLRRRRA